MRKIFGRTVGSDHGSSSGLARIGGLSRVLGGGVLLLVLLLHPVQVLSVAPPGSYSVTVTWDSNPSPEVVGFRIHYGTASGSYTGSVVAATATNGTVPGLVGGVAYFFAVTAFDASGLESGFSAEVSYVPSLPPVRFGVTAAGQLMLSVQGVTGQSYDIEATEDFKSWTVISTVTVGAGGTVSFTDPNAANYARRFYRTCDVRP